MTTIFWVCKAGCTEKNCDCFGWNCDGCENCAFTRHEEKARKYTITGTDEIED